MVTEYLHDRPNSQHFNLSNWGTEMHVDFMGVYIQFDLLEMLNAKE